MQDRPYKYHIRVETLEGTMHGKPRDYLVINDETEECWPVKEEVKVVGCR